MLVGKPMTKGSTATKGSSQIVSIFSAGSTVRGGCNRQRSSCPARIRLQPLIAVDVLQQDLHVRIRTPKAGRGVWDHVNGGYGHKAEPNASGLASTCTLGGIHCTGSVVQHGANALQKNTAGPGERDRSFRTNEELDANLAL